MKINTNATASVWAIGKVRPIPRHDGAIRSGPTWKRAAIANGTEGKHANTALSPQLIGGINARITV